MSAWIERESEGTPDECLWVCAADGEYVWSFAPNEESQAHAIRSRLDAGESADAVRASLMK